MFSKNSGQMNPIDKAIFEQLIPKDHLLVKINKAFDFDFLYEKLKSKYSDIGRHSKDPVMMLKILLLEFIYNLSDVQIARRIQTDIAFRWFLNLSINDTGPDDTTISYFRTRRIGDEDFELLFTSIVKQCIEKDIVKTRRYLVDSTNVDANVNYPSDKKLLRQAVEKVAKEIRKFNPVLEKQWTHEFESTIEKFYEQQEKVHPKAYYETAKQMLEALYCKTYDELQKNSKYIDAYTVCYELVDRYLLNKKDKIISVVDPEARVAYKSSKKTKTGYKNHIIVDEDSEIILGSVQTPFNVGDQKELLPLVEQVEQNYHLKPKELSADKVYGTTKNRADLKDKDIISNINFYAETAVEADERFTTQDFLVSEDIRSMTCPNGIVTNRFRDVVVKSDEDSYPYRDFKFDKRDCDNCPNRDKCLNKKNGKFTERSKRIRISSRYDAIARDKERSQTAEFNDALNLRFKIERRFATQVNHHGARRTRYIGLAKTKIQINLVNTVTNLIRAIHIIESLNAGTA